MKIIDFETCSEVDLRQTGAFAYAMHPSTRVLMLRYADFGGSVKGWDYDEKWPDIDPAEGLVAHNVEFELAIWNITLKRQVPHRKPFRPEHAHDTAALAAAAGLPRSLDGAAKAMQLRHQKQADAGRRLIKFWSVLAVSEPHKNRHTFPKEWIEFGSYCEDDVKTTAELFEALPPLSERERAIFIEHMRINMRGIRADIPRIKKLRQICLAAEAQLTQGPHGALLRWPPALVTWLSALGVEVESAEAENLEAALATAKGEAAELITKRLEFAKASTKKYKRAILADGGDGRLRGLHVYFGAHTGRWSGAILQPQNIIRACVKDIDYNVGLLDSLPENPSEAIGYLGGPGDTLRWASWMVRPMLAATPGKVLGVADYSAIEAVELAWLVGAKRLQEQYQTRQDPYKNMASSIYHIPVDDIEEDSRERFVGKQVILGCGYGMGHTKFIERCLLENVQLSNSEGKLAVSTYREDNHEIPAGWRAIDETVAIVMDPTEWNRGRFLFGDKLIFWVTTHGNKLVALNCRLPSKRILSWKYPKYIQMPNSNPERGHDLVLTYLTPQHDTISAAATIRARASAAKVDPAQYLRHCTVELEGLTRTTSWGGKLIENIVQAISRDILAEAMLRVSPKSPVVMHVHDEIVSELDDKGKLSEFQQAMEVVPEWNEGACIRVKAWAGERYRK